MRMGSVDAPRIILEYALRTKLVVDGLQSSFDIS